jgi:ATP-binding cassette subfamily B protein
VLGIFVIIWFIEWRIAILFLLSFVLILSFSLKDLKQLMVQERRLDRYMENTQSRTSEIITNIKTVKAFATEPVELKRQQQRLNREFKVVIQHIHLGYIKLATWQRTIIQFCVFVVLGLTLAATLQGKISLGHFVTTLTVSSMAYAELGPISDLAEIFARRYASMLSFHEFMQQPVGVDAASFVMASSAAATTYHFTGKLEFHHVSFGYDPRRPVLQNINLLIEPYQTLALVGRSGSGKSTLVKLLLRYFEPNQGQILIDGQDIRRLDVANYRRRLAIVHQEVDVFNGTLLDNITYGNREASFEQVQEACRIARVDEVIQQLPEGYYTVVGERGVRLSGGQRQRLGIARSLLVEPDVLIFDEATSSLDYESERAIQLAMRSILGTRTTIIIAHRLSTVREADKIVVLDQGKIVEVGSHAELLRREGIYQRLHSLQETGELLT